MALGNGPAIGHFSSTPLSDRCRNPARPLRPSQKRARDPQHPNPLLRQAELGAGRGDVPRCAAHLEGVEAVK